MGVSAGRCLKHNLRIRTKLNYTEAVASFTEAIKLDPDNIQAYMGRAEAYLALGEYDKALKDYQFVCGKTEEMPYTRALSYIGQAEVYERMDKPEKALSDYELSKALLNASDAGKAENVSEEETTSASEKQAGKRRNEAGKARFKFGTGGRYGRSCGQPRESIYSARRRKTNWVTYTETKTSFMGSNCILHVKYGI